MAEGQAPKQPQWMTPATALALLSGRFPDAADAKFAIIQYAATGAIRSRCKQGTIAPEMFAGRQASKPIEAGTVLKKEFWAAFGDSKEPLAENWTVAVFSTRGVRVGSSPFHTNTVRLVGVEFHHADLRNAFDLGNGLKLPVAGRLTYNPRPVGRLEQIAPELIRYLAPTSQTASEENVPKNVPSRLIKPLAAAEFDAWYADQPPEIQSWGGVKLRKKCSQDHDGRRVLKKATDKVTQGRTTGRKPGSKNVPR